VNKDVRMYQTEVQVKLLMSQYVSTRYTSVTDWSKKEICEVLTTSVRKVY